VGAHDLAAFCVGHELRLTLPATYFPPTHKTHPFTGPRAVRVYDSFASPATPLQVAVYFLDLPLDDDPDGLEFETGMIPVSNTKRGPWTLLRALKTSFPHARHLKDLLPDAATTVVFRNKQLPIYRVVASQSVGGGDRGNDLLVQFAKGNLDDSAWIHERYVPISYQDRFWDGVERDEPPDSKTSQGPQGTWLARPL